jgi:predicted NAD-dependent protein-ADP-ribosyltransferase YbiA (DUF1768 family)
MVHSKINTNVIYNENRKIHPEDKGFESSVYEMDIFNKEIVVTLGKPKYEHSTKNIVYYHIYLISDTNGIEGCLGVFEVKSNRVLELLDEDGDIDITKFGSPLLFDFAEKLISRTKTDVEKYINAVNAINVEQTNNRDDNNNDNNDDNHDEDDEDDMMKLSKKIKKTTPENATTAPKKEGIFVIDDKLKPPPSLKEETETDADEIKRKFKSSSRNNWVENFMENNNYKIHDVKGDGDCFFTVVKNAFDQIGKHTTIQKLRNILAEEVTDEIFQEQRVVYLSIEGEIRKYSKEMETVKKTLEVDLKERSIMTKSKKDVELLVNEANRLKERYTQMQIEKTGAEQILKSIMGNLSNVTTLDLFKEYIKSSNYWADTWAISTIEHKLNIKLIIFNETSYNEGAKNSVLNCGEVNKNIESAGIFRPEYYIMTAYTGNHYQLVSYKSKKILQYPEIPYHIKILVLNKCLEQNAGIYYLIQDFRDLKTKLNIEPDAGNPHVSVEMTENDDNEEGNNERFDPNIVFMFHIKSENKAKPGKGSGEKIPHDKINEYISLGTIDNWRRKLDDTWKEAIFAVDGKKYASVEHYYQGAKFKNGFPDFAFLFSLDSDSDISKDVALCKSAGSKTGKMKTQLVRPKNVKIDAEFYPLRNLEEREKAVFAKFSQNEELKTLLVKTKNAKLTQYIVKNPAETDVILMKTREILSRN